MCKCFDCQRAEGVTDNNATDCLRLHRYRADGRFTEQIKTVKTEEGHAVQIPEGLPGRFIGT